MRKKKKSILESHAHGFGFGVMIEAKGNFPPVLIISTSLPMVKVAVSSIIGEIPQTKDIGSIGWVQVDKGELALSTELKERGECTAPVKRRKRRKSKGTEQEKPERKSKANPEK